MISFIIIGKNEGWRLEKCLLSVFNVVETDKISNYEVIYVDSQSTDDSLKVAKSFQTVKTILITGACNAAVARNVGATEAVGGILFFIDGDMEIQPGFLSSVLNREGELVYPFMSGNFIDVVYDEKWKFIYERQRTDAGINGKYEAVVGGLFIINKSVWEDAGGMDTRQKRSQDYDLGLCIAKRGILLYRKNQIIAFHHMINYSLRADFVRNVKYTALLFRKHWDNKFYIKVFLKQHYTSVALVLSLIGMCVFSWCMVILYLVALAYKTKSVNRKARTTFLQLLKSLFLRDLYFFWALLFFRPKKVEMLYKYV